MESKSDILTATIAGMNNESRVKRNWGGLSATLIQHIILSVVESSFEFLVRLTRPQPS